MSQKLLILILFLSFSCFESNEQTNLDANIRGIKIANAFGKFIEGKQNQTITL